MLCSKSFRKFGYRDIEWERVKIAKRQSHKVRVPSYTYGLCVVCCCVLSLCIGNLAIFEATAE